MIEILDKSKCCGCSACVQRCPKNCISFREDEEGFRYPIVNKEICIECGLCETVCPVLNSKEIRKPKHIYAAINPNETARLKSSSGGVFSMLAETIIEKGGVVFGVRFDEKWQAIHDYIETKEELKTFRGSKYVQSQILESYIQTQIFLEQGRLVLFSGTPCQIAGLKNFLHKEYNCLITVDVVCHGAPSPLIWREYLKFEIGYKTITDINFRNKEKNWRSSKLSIRSQNHKIVNEYVYKNKYMQWFLKNFSLRPSCFNCKARCGKSGSDIQLGDFWGINRCHPEFNSSLGVSLVLTYSDKGEQLFSSLSLYSIKATYEEALDSNINIEKDEDMPEGRNLFWDLFSQNGVKGLIERDKRMESINLIYLIKKTACYIKIKLKIK